MEVFPKIAPDIGQLIIVHYLNDEDLLPFALVNKNWYKLIQSGFPGQLLLFKYQKQFFWQLEAKAFRWRVKYAWLLNSKFSLFHHILCLISLGLSCLPCFQPWFFVYAIQPIFYLLTTGGLLTLDKYHDIYETNQLTQDRNIIHGVWHGPRTKPSWLIKKRWQHSHWRYLCCIIFFLFSYVVMVFVWLFLPFWIHIKFQTLYTRQEMRILLAYALFFQLTTAYFIPIFSKTILIAYYFISMSLFPRSTIWTSFVLGLGYWLLYRA